MPIRLFITTLLLASAGAQAAPQDYLYTGSGDLPRLNSLLQRPDIAGAQVVYNWKMLETAPGVYDFSRIEADLALTRQSGKKLFIQIQDRFFAPDARHLPDYLLQDPAYHGGLAPQWDNPGEGKAKAQGWVAMQWREPVRLRYQALLSALAKAFDGRVAGVNLPETAIDIDPKRQQDGFSCDAYFQAELDNMRHARRVFTHSAVVQYVNFWPCEWQNDHRYMSRLFAEAKAVGVGLGGPDVVPWKKGQMANSYPFFHSNKGQLSLVAMAVQEPTLSYTNPKTGKPFTRQEFSRFAEDYLGADILFWSPDSPWLKRAPKHKPSS